MKPSVFRDHLDICRQCDDNPFDLCDEGRRLLREAVDAVLKDDRHTRAADARPEGSANPSGGDRG